MELEKIYWIAGIVSAFSGVVALFKFMQNRRTSIKQNAKVSGQNNSVSQRVENKGDERHGD